MVINKIVFTSPEAMREFSGEKIKPPRSSKPLELQASSCWLQLAQRASCKINFLCTLLPEG